MDNTLSTNNISVVFVYSPAPREIVEKMLVLPQASTVNDALNVAHSSFSAMGAECHIGVWGKKVSPKHVLQDGDRLELYRSLKVDPKVARRERFQKQGARTAGLFAKTRVGGKAGY